LSKVSQKLSKICQNLSKNNQKVVKKMSKKCQKVVKKVQKALSNPLGQKAQLEKLPHSYQFLSIVTFGHFFSYIKKR
jgi:hypothetical protein